MKVTSYKDRIKVAFVVRNLEYVGGTEKFILSFINFALAKKDIELSIFCLEGTGNVADNLRSKGIRVYDFPSSCWCNIYTAYKLAQLFKKLKIDIVHSHLFNADFIGETAALVAGIPSISTKYCMFSRALEKNTRFERIILKPLIDFLLERLVDLMTTKILVVSKGVKSYFLGLGVSGRKMVIAPCASIDIAKQNQTVSKVKARSSFSLPKTKIIIGSTARLVPEKGIDTLLTAFSLLIKQGRDVYLAIAGGGFLKYQMEKLVQSLQVKNRVFFLGEVNDIDSFLSSLDIFVLASRSEGLPLALQEAMWRGLPIVSTKVGGIPELMDSSQDLLVPPDQPELLAKKIMTLLESKTSWGTIGNKNKLAIRDQYNIATVYGTILDNYKDLLSR